LFIDAIEWPQRPNGAGDQRIGLSARIGAVASRQEGAAKNLRRTDELADEHHRRHRQELSARDQRCAPALDAFGKVRILRALGVANALAPFAARDLEEIARLAAADDDPIEMRPDQAIDPCPASGTGSSAASIAA
jgi:hypothetical protein